MAAGRDRLRIGYIGGYGRSGSTIFDIILGEHPELVGVGELTNLTRRVWPNNEYCSCRQPVRDCSFWGMLVERFLARFGTDALVEYSRLQVRHERLDNVLRCAIGFDRSTGGRDDYNILTEGIYDLIAELSGRSTIIDSSKLPGRALALVRHPAFDLRLIHLVRDGRGVAWSMSKSFAIDRKSGLERRLPARSAIRTALRWAMVNLATEWVARQIAPPRAVRLRYEDLVAAPDRELDRVGEVLEIDVRSLLERLSAGAPFRPVHLVAGSRWRMAGPIKLRLDQEWQTVMPASERHAVQWLCGRLQRRYGYA